MCLTVILIVDLYKNIMNWGGHPVDGCVRWADRGLGGGLFWVVASARGAVGIVEPTRLYNPSGAAFGGLLVGMICCLGLLVRLLGAFGDWVFALLCF